ncbi:DUF1573 domain-containing protein [Aerosakkonema funiforme]|uniref:DUF1573 domain-containing protein n=1 Tax=Aerosakkonema funiforme TaxID=1246630 RepID=UPI0035B98DFB
MCCSPHQHHHHRSEQKPFFKIGLGIVGSLVLIAAGYGYWNNVQTAKAALLKYSPQDIAKDRPLRAEHSHAMAGHIGGIIPFLPKDQPQPKISVSQTLYDFGTIGPKDIVKQTFIIRNTGQGTLTISNAYTTCGCTTADFSSSVIPAGKVALVTVTFDAGFHDTRGQSVRRGIIIENNDPNQSKVEIWIKANVRQS